MVFIIIMVSLYFIINLFAQRKKKKKKLNKKLKSLKSKSKYKAESKEDLENIYSGGECGSLAIFLANKFNAQIYEVSGIKDWDGKIIPRTDYHFFVEIQGLFFDIYGWNSTISNVISNFESFDESCKLEVRPDYVR